jgi:hypothetical protein
MDVVAHKVEPINITLHGNHIEVLQVPVGRRERGADAERTPPSRPHLSDKFGEVTGVCRQTTSIVGGWVSVVRSDAKVILSYKCLVVEIPHLLPVNVDTIKAVSLHEVL